MTRSLSLIRHLEFKKKKLKKKVNEPSKGNIWRGKRNIGGHIETSKKEKKKEKETHKNKFIYFQIKFESIREVYKEQQQPIFFYTKKKCTSRDSCAPKEILQPTSSQ